MPTLPRVAHILVPYIRNTETFIYDRLTHHLRYDPFVLTDEPPLNTGLLPFSPIVSLADRALLARKADTAARRLSGVSPFFHRELRRRNTAVVHAHYGPVGAAALKSAESARKPLVVSFYGIDASAFLKDPRHRASYRRMFLRADIISVLSGDMADGLTEAGCPREKIRVHHLALDVSRYKPAPPPTGGPLKIVSVGRFVPKKGFSMLLAACGMFVENFGGAELHLYGSGPLENEMKKLSAGLKLDGAIFFHGHQPREAILEAIGAAHIFALFSTTGPDGDREGTPTVLIEAGALGIPSVSTLHAGIPEVVENGVTGLLTEEKDVDGFAQHLLRLAEDPELRARLGRAARARIERDFDIRSVMKQIEDTYDELV